MMEVTKEKEMQKIKRNRLNRTVKFRFQNVPVIIKMPS
jgi:phenylacetate-coenzyme A ligase PaaK-like adenylate-forming protein